jgi:hypothetical protein
MNEKKIKHLEFLQNVITRMNSNSFLIKGWTVTIVSALFALASKDANINYILVSYIAIPLMKKSFPTDDVSCIGTKNSTICQSFLSTILIKLNKTNI